MTLPLKKIDPPIPYPWNRWLLPQRISSVNTPIFFSLTEHQPGLMQIQGRVITTPWSSNIFFFISPFLALGRDNRGQNQFLVRHRRDLTSPCARIGWKKYKTHVNIIVAKNSRTGALALQKTWIVWRADGGNGVRWFQKIFSGSQEKCKTSEISNYNRQIIHQKSNLLWKKKYCRVKLQRKSVGDNFSQ